MAGSITERQLAAFRAVMISGSVSGGARAIGLSQPAVSAVIRRLEDVIGVPLFERAGNRIVPTVEAQRVFAEVQLVFGQFDRLAESIRAIARGERGYFRLGVSPSVSRTLVPRALARLKQRHPDLRCFYDSLTRDRIADYLCLGEGECVVTIAPVDNPAVRAERLGAGRLVCVLPVGHRLAGRRTLRPADIAGEPLVSFEAGTVHGELIDRLYEAAGAERRTQMFVRSTEMAIAFVAEGFGVAILDGFSAMGCKAFGLVALPMAGSAPIPVFLQWCSFRSRSALVPELAAATRAIIAGRSP